MSSKSTSKPKPKELVQLLCKFEQMRFNTSVDRTTGKEKVVKNNVYICPNKQFINGDHCEIIFPEESGYMNPFVHLKSCIANGDVDELIRIYDVNREKQLKASMPEFFKPTLSVTLLENALFDNIELVVMKNLPLSLVQDATFRQFSKHDIEIGKMLFKETLFKLGK